MATQPQRVRSTDGTSIAFEVTGAGPTLVLVHGSVCDRTYWAPVVPALARQFTVVTVDRRGHGASGDAEGYTIEREFDDIASVVDSFASPVALLGHSYGAICTLEAALRTRNLRSLLLYEPPIGTGDAPERFIVELEELVARGDREQAVTLFMGEMVGLPPDVLAELRGDAAAWQPMVDTVHTLPREIRSAAAFAFDADRYKTLGVPTVLLCGSESPPVLRIGVALVQEAVDGAHRIEMQGVDHEAVTTGPAVLVESIEEALAATETA